MKAVILAAGKGTRMGDLTANLPKPMVQVEGKPVLEHIVEGLRDEAGITDFFIITGWCGNVIRDHFGRRGLHYRRHFSESRNFRRAGSHR
jgi:NDP-sugar pyrophosphorylase family protein